jgi:hypothetical protein
VETKNGSRRWFLRGAAGTTLAIPAMPSLLSPSEAKAATAGGKIFIGVMSAYGGVWSKKMFPTMGSNADSMTYAGRKIRRTALTGSVTGGNTVLSEVLTAPSSVLTPALVQKMSLLQGIDIPFDCNHHSAATFGNYAQGDGKVKLSGGAQNATIDQTIAQSPAFYSDLSGVTQPSVFYSSFGDLSFRNKVAGKPDSGVEKMSTYMNPESLWTALFGSAKPAAQQRASVVDLVYDDYVRMRSNSKLGALDKARLEDHIARVADIKRRQNVTISCTKPTRPTNFKDSICGDWQNHADLYLGFQDTIVAALACGLTRVVTSLHQGWNTTFGEICEDPWHQKVSHDVLNAAPEQSMAMAMQRQFAKVIVPLASKLDAVKDASGASLLDRSMLYWTHEHGVHSHAQESIPVITFGGANGAFATGQHMDYRDMTRVIPKDQFGSATGPVGDSAYVGLTWHQMLGSLAQGFAIPKSEWMQPNHGGYGLRPTNGTAASYNDRYKMWGTAEWAVSGEKLPWWLT